VPAVWCGVIVSRVVPGHYVGQPTGTRTTLRLGDVHLHNQNNSNKITSWGRYRPEGPYRLEGHCHPEGHYHRAGLCPEVSHHGPVV